MRLHARFLLAFLALGLLAACDPGSTRQDAAMVQTKGDVLAPIVTPAVYQQPKQNLNAGEVDDNSQWGSYLEYRDDFLRRNSYAVHDIDVSQKQLITVTDQQNHPIIGAQVWVYDQRNLIAESRTYANGETAFFPKAWTQGQNATTYRVVVQKENAAVQFKLNPQSGSSWNIKLDTAQQVKQTPLDILFLLDTTGSMGDEIAQLQNNILAISEHVNQLQNNVDVHYGLVLYRDRGDEYVTQTHDFVSNVNDFQAQLNAVRAGGGGDTPESLNEGLHAAVQGVSWRGDDAIKLIFLVADAAPHLDYANDYNYTQEMAAAAWNGIKVYPIASSGLTSDGEFIFRQIAQYTLGHFLFLTYQQGTSGAAGSERTDLQAGSTGNYTVDQLDELVEKLIVEEVTSLTTTVTPSGTVPQVVSVAPQKADTIPASFALAQSQYRPPASVSVPAPNPPPALYVPPRSTAPQIDISVSLADVVLIMVILIGGIYWLFFSRTVEKRKRKNEEILLEGEE